MKQVLILFTCLIFFVRLSYSQKEGNVWYFGENAGLDFNSNPPTALTDGSLNTQEGCSSICDTNGDLLFYSDGINVWNRNHQIMPNGFGLLGDISSSQSVIIVKKPNSNTNYYLFTVDDHAGVDGLNYSEVDISLQRGLGDVNSIKNISLQSPICEKVTAVKHQNKKDYWIIIQLFGVRGFESYLLTESGVSPTPIHSDIGTIVSDTLQTIGCLKASVEGNKIVSATNSGNYVEVFDFDNASGLLSNTLKFSGFGIGSYGSGSAEFSPNGKVLYISLISPIEVYQMNLEGGNYNDIENSRILVGNIFSSILAGGALQIGPDGKIYMSIFSSDHLAVINYPNSLGYACDFVREGVYLEGKKSFFGLPNSCSSDLEIAEPTIEMPNIFTPNNDGVNDVFSSISSEWLEETTLSIFNRWGVNLYSSDLKAGWDGINKNGEKAPNGVYYYLLTNSGAKRKAGFFTLIR